MASAAHPTPSGFWPRHSPYRSNYHQNRIDNRWRGRLLIINNIPNWSTTYMNLLLLLVLLYLSSSINKYLLNIVSVASTDSSCRICSARRYCRLYINIYIASIHRLIISPIPCHICPRPSISDTMLLIVVYRRLFILTPTIIPLLLLGVCALSLSFSLSL